MKRMRWDALADRLPHDRPIVGAEVGVWNGKMSEQMLKRFPLLTLYLVDRWQPPTEDDSYYHSGSVYALSRAEAYEIAFQTTEARIAPFENRTVLMIRDSVDAAAGLIDYCLDFAFIDADHSYEGVARDLAAWIPNVKPGGLICGHDYDHPDQGEVKRAVDEFFADWPGTIELDANRTWFYRIPEAP